MKSLNLFNLIQIALSGDKPVEEVRESLNRVGTKVSLDKIDKIRKSKEIKSLIKEHETLDKLYKEKQSEQLKREIERLENRINQLTS